MKNNYDDLDKALNVESSIVEVEGIDICVALFSDRSIVRRISYTSAKGNWLGFQLS